MSHIKGMRGFVKYPLGVQGQVNFDHTIATAAARALYIDIDTSVSSGNCACMELAYTNTTSGINNMRAFTSDLTLGANCAGPYAGYFRVDIADATVTGLSAALGMELILSSVSGANGEAHGMTIDVACPDATSSPGSGSNKHSFIKLETWGNAAGKGAWDDNANIFFINGPTAGAGNIISADTNTMRMNIGGTSYYIPLSATENVFDFDITSTATSGNLNVVDIDLTVGAAGTVNDRALTSDLTMSANCAGPYAAYFRTDCVTYQVLGLGAALGMEVCLPGTTITSGEFHCMTLDFECAAGGAGFGSGSGKHSFIKCEIWGDTTAMNNFDDGWNLFYINNCSAGDGSMFNTAPTGTCQIEAALRIYVDDTPYWIALMDTYNGA